jgi:hypothetical protein
MPQNQAVRLAYVNIQDLVDNPRLGRPVKTFTTEHALSHYTIDSGKFFPKENAYAGGLLRHLLRDIEEPGKRQSPLSDKKRPSTSASASSKSS